MQRPRRDWTPVEPFWKVMKPHGWFQNGTCSSLRSAAGLLALRESRRGRPWAGGMRPGTLRVALQRYLSLSPSFLFLYVFLIGFGRRRKGQSSNCFRILCEYQGLGGPTPPEEPRTHAKKAPRRPKIASERRKMAQDGPKMAHANFKMAPSWSK